MGNKMHELLLRHKTKLHSKFASYYFISKMIKENPCSTENAQTSKSHLLSSIALHVLECVVLLCLGVQLCSRAGTSMSQLHEQY